MAGRVWEFVQRGDAVLVDLREPHAFARGHPKGAVSLPYSHKGLAERLAVVLSRGTRVVLLAPDAATAAAGIEQLRGSLFQVLGLIEYSAWQKAGLPEESVREILVEDLAKVLLGQELTIIDVREPVEWETGHVPGALLVSLGRLRERLSTIPHAPPVALICESGVRSSTAASILQGAGFPEVANVPEGTRGYRQTGLLLEFPAPGAGVSP